MGTIKTRFDHLATTYVGGMEDPCKRLVAGKYELLVHLKLRCLRQIQRMYFGEKKIRILDFGCGTGEIAAGLAAHSGILQIVAADESLGMIHEARRRHAERLPNVRWTLLRRPQLALGKFDWIISVNTFHHIPPARRASTARRLFASLAAGGVLTILEHNPRNPLTRWIVARCPFDRGVKLLSVREAQALLGTKAGPVQIRYLGFLPPFVPGSAWLEKLLGKLPWGVQFLAWAQKASV